MTLARETDTARLLVLLAHYRLAGVCWRCRQVFAVARIERERGELDAAVAQWCARPDRCRDRANAARKTMPPK